MRFQLFKNVLQVYMVTIEKNSCMETSFKIFRKGSGIVTMQIRIIYWNTKILF